LDLKTKIALAISILIGYFFPVFAAIAGLLLLGLGLSPVYFPKMGPFLKEKGWPRKYVLIIAFATLITSRLVRLADQISFL
jgi:uncharacterized membrane protein YphA (DoxX/SURF4 family)